MTSDTKSKEIAFEYNKRADEALQKDDPETARKFYLKAIYWDPDETIGTNGIANLEHLAEVYYIQARDLCLQGHKKAAIERFKKVLRYAQENTKYHRYATRQLGKLRSEPPESND